MIFWNWSDDGWIMLVGMLSACSCALLGVYLVLRRMSLMGDAISHAVLPGLVLAFIISNSRAAWPMFIGAVIVGMLTALLTQAIATYGKVEHGAAMGVVFSVLFACGLILVEQTTKSVDLDPQCVLFGNIVLTPLDTVLLFGAEIPRAAVFLSVVFCLDVLFVALFFKELKICAFDSSLASTIGINASLMHYGLMVAVAVTVVAAFESVGSILVIAMLIVPAAAAHLLTDRLVVMIVLSMVIAAASAIGGHLLGVFGPAWVGLSDSLETSGMMAVVAGAILVAALFLSPEYGIIGKLYHRLALSFQIVREDVLGLVYRWQEMRPDGDRAIRRAEILQAIGDGILARWTLGSLRRRREIAIAPDRSGRDVSITLTSPGHARACHLVRSHRLWESYLAKHFHLPLDHLHMPAERVEHFITPAMRDELDGELIGPARDPHGRVIPDRDESSGV